jgi:hypothetical protein
LRKFFAYIFQDESKNIAKCGHSLLPKSWLTSTTAYSSGMCNALILMKNIAQANFST